MKLHAAILLALTTGTSARSPVTVTGLRTEYRANPVGTDATRPRFSWQLSSDTRNTVQSAYDIQVATDTNAFRTGRGLVWSSGRITSDASTFIPYAGPALTSRTRYFWHVRVWDASSTASAWSTTAFWETGMLSPSDWSAKWIGPPAAMHDSAGAPAPMLRRAFMVQGRVASARAYITSRGLYELHLNGHRVSEDVFTPGWTAYKTRLQYQTYDVTSLLTPGENAIGTILGDGWYRGYLGFTGRKNDYGTTVALLVQLEIRYADGRTVHVTSDSAWKVATGPIRYADIYRGETYDARLERTGWDAPHYDDHDWLPVAMAAPTTAALVAPVSEPVRRTQTVMPVAILKSPSGQAIVDLGQNITGWVRLRLHAARGTTVTLHHAEVLDKAGNLYTDNLRAADQVDRYTAKGDPGDEVFEPQFTYHGFRYVWIEGNIPTPTLQTVTGIVVHSDLAETGTFVTSDSMINKLQRNILWGQRGNFLDVPTDCPQRDERLGWTGDAQVFARTAAFNMNVSGFFAKWLADLAADQFPGGSVPWVIPNPLFGDSTQYAATAGWSDASTVVPWTMYLMYGDKGVLERQFESMHKWVDFARRRAGPTLIWRAGGFGDWLALHSDDASYPGATTGKDFIATAYLAHSADIVARAAAVIGRQTEATRYRSLFDSIKEAFRREFVSPNGRVSENTQTAYALALDFGLLTDAEIPGAAQRLANDVRARGNHLTTGFLGTPELTHALSRNGFTDAAYTLLLQRSYPSWLYPITRGATTMWERWDGIRPDSSFEDVSMNSFNHYAFGAIGDWMYRTIGGVDIDPDAPGYKHTVIAPRPGGGMTSASLSLETMYGTLATAWSRNNEAFTLNITVPANTSATVTLWDTKPGNVMEGGVSVSTAPGVRRVTQDGANVKVEVGSGRYAFRIAR